ncbi:hypothetical protein [Fundicoccus culcitae]|uniref:Uncharacterized protein n=1 Tax=Fundicoccus culcitae TaxID=2969821 RepID=A0ABY5P9U1_9LACT|nr:hypothetical protein [Fundicoccus culcitae]UUX35225.1 hypothetical protein NRE15_06170 [Fundicoccus culcitae]
MKIEILWVVMICILTFLLGGNKHLQERIKSNSKIFYGTLIFILFFLITIILTEIDFFNNGFISNYINTLMEILKLILLSLGVFGIGFAIYGFWGKKYSLRIDNFNIGGLNVFFDKSSEIFKKAVGSFLESKRSLFCFKPDKDNISEVLDSYYSTYKFIRENLELLDREKDEALYSLSVGILKTLNTFLTNHQNDYRRWYEKILKDDSIVSNDKKIVVHETTIEIVQTCYYRYDEIVRDFKVLNKELSDEKILETFRLDKEKWSGY